MSKFIKFVGHVALNGRQIALTDESDGNIKLQVETVGGKRVPGFKSLTIPRAEFDALESEWYVGVHRGDARIVERAMEFLAN